MLQIRLLFKRISHCISLMNDNAFFRVCVCKCSCCSGISAASKTLLYNVAVITVFDKPFGRDKQYRRQATVTCAVLYVVDFLRDQAITRRTELR